MKIGAHVSTAHPFSDAIDRATSLGCEAIQIFANPPQRWNPVTIPQNEIDLFNQKKIDKKISPIIIHAIYLINLASENPFFYESSIRSLIDDMKKAKALGAIGVNFHLGSTKGRKLEEVMDKIFLGIKNVLAATDDDIFLILENSAGAGNIIGDKIEELATIYKAVGSDRIKLTIDTAHAFASGYNLKEKQGLEDIIKEIDQQIGLDNLVCLHLNDSAVPWGSNRDRHADIGEGYIGIDAFERIVNHPLLKDKFGIVETPGNKGKSDIDNIKILKNLRR